VKDFRKLLESKTGFIPRTQAQALRGYTEGILNPEYYIYKAVNIHPILEEPWDMHEMDRLLAKPDLDIETASLLMTVFERMIKHRDKELALFAAESINALERRYIAKVQALKKLLETDPALKTYRAIIAEYRTMARLFVTRPVLGVFYLDEARSFHERNAAKLKDPDLDLAVYIGTLLEARDLEKAGNTLRSALETYPGNDKLRFLSAKYAYLGRRHLEVVRNLELIQGVDAGPGYAEIQEFWTGASCRE
jgi:hypothetical protein